MRSAPVPSSTFLYSTDTVRSRLAFVLCQLEYRLSQGKGETLQFTGACRDYVILIASILVQITVVVSVLLEVVLRA